MKLQSRKYLLIVLALLFIFPIFSQAQEPETPVNNQYWIDFIPHYRLSDAFEFYSDASFRIREVGNWKILTIRPSFKYQTTPSLSIHAGIGIFYNAINDLPSYIEFRPWQGIRLGWPKIWHLNFKHFIRTEERYYYYPTDDLNSFWNYRARYQLSTKVPLNKKIIDREAIYIPIAFEWLASSNNSFEVIWASQSRITTGLGIVLSKKWILEFEYMHWWSRNNPANELQSAENVFRIKFLRDGWIFGE